MPVEFSITMSAGGLKASFQNAQTIRPEIAPSFGLGLVLVIGELRPVNDVCHPLALAFPVEHPIALRQEEGERGEQDTHQRSQSKNVDAPFSLRLRRVRNRRRERQCASAALGTILSGQERVNGWWYQTTSA